MAGKDEQDAEIDGVRFAPRMTGPSSGNTLIGHVPASVAVLGSVVALTFLALWIAPASIEADIAERYGLSPERLAAGGAGPGGWYWAIAPLFTHILIHATAAHLLFNLLWLFVFGTPIARRFNSPLRFFAFFAFSGAAGGAFFSLFHLGDATLLIGASGGITGLLGGLVRFAFHRPYSRPASENGVLPLSDRSVLSWSFVVVAMNASIAIFGPGIGAGDAEIAWEAHVGGYLFGLVAFPLFDPKRTRR